MNELEIFQYTDKVLKILDELNVELEDASEEIVTFFNNILKRSKKSRIGIISRIKSKNSLKGKIFRDKYFEHFTEPYDVIDNLSDLIGVRIECRFNKDEEFIYNLILENFDLIDENGLYFSEESPNIFLDLEDPQPQIQNNGFKIYKIDGFYYKEDLKLNFELQIKSLVNVFWSEIEHEIIYKNNDYNIWDDFFEKILGSIKQNLSMIDQQLRILDDHFTKISTKDLNSRKLALEKNLSQMIYTMFSNKMKNSMGFVVNFNESCDSIVKYLFRSQGADDLYKYQKTFSKTFSTLNELEKLEIDFKKRLLIERPPVFVGDFTEKFGNIILKKIDNEFDWSVFFRILFEIEPGNNVEDFEIYLAFLKYRFSSTPEFVQVGNEYGYDYRENLTESVLDELYNAFLDVNKLDFLYDTNLENVNNIIRELLKLFYNKASDYNVFKENEEVLLYLIRFQINAYFDKAIDIKQVQQMMNFLIKNSKTERISFSDVYKYINKNIE